MVCCQFGNARSNARLLLIRQWGMNFSEIQIKIQIFRKEMKVKMLSAISVGPSVLSGNMAVCCDFIGNRYVIYKILEFRT